MPVPEVQDVIPVIQEGGQVKLFCLIKNVIFDHLNLIQFTKFLYE